MVEGQKGKRQRGIENLHEHQLVHWVSHSRGRRRRPLSPTERRELPYGQDTARGPLAGIGAAAPAADPLPVDWSLRNLRCFVLAVFKNIVFSPHLCVGFLFLVVHFRLAPLPLPPAARRLLLTHNLSPHNLFTHNLLTHTQLVSTQLVHTQLDHTQLVTTQLVHTQLVTTQLVHT